MTRAIPVLAAAALAVAACGNKGPSYDRKSPENTVRSFFKALEDGRIPRDLERFFVDEHEVAVWKLRCKHRGCTGGKVYAVTVEEKYDYRATLKIKYEVTGTHGTRIMHGDDAELTLTREGRNWYIQQFGKRRAVPSSNPSIDAGSGPGRDAG
jgi:myo-inositol-hexaphosphate 3-phosphohydrolase